jgi:hypothetical protein
MDGEGDSTMDGDERMEREVLRSEHTDGGRRVVTDKTRLRVLPGLAVLSPTILARTESPDDAGAAA